jgi:hypothetical protein
MIEVCIHVLVDRCAVRLSTVRGKEMVEVVIVKGDTTYAKVDLSGFESVHVYGLHVCFVCYEGYREKGVSWMGWRMETTVK